MLREVLRDVLAGRGYEVVAAARGDEAVGRAKGEHFDLIIADIRMEGMSGLDAIEQAQQIQPGIGSIVVSGWATEEETLRAVKLNVAGYLKKPFSIDSLLELVNAHLAKRREELKRERSVRRAREALLWSIEQQGKWAERCRPGEVLRAAHLAARLARRMGFSGDLARQLYLGVLLRQVFSLGEDEVPQHVADSLSTLPLLLNSLLEEEPSEIAALAVTVCAGLTQDAALPPPEALPESVTDALREAYRGAAEGGAPGIESRDHSGLFSLAQTLEHAADWQGASRVYREIVENEGISHQAGRALLGKARAAVALGDVKGLEEAVKRTLEVSKHLGPISFAVAEMETGLLLKRMNHPSTLKLLARAAANLEAVGLSFPLALVRVSQWALKGVKEDQALLDDTIVVLLSDDHRAELLESCQELLPDLFTLAGRWDSAKIKVFLARILSEHPEEIVASLSTDRLDVQSKGVLAALLQETDRAIPGKLRSLLVADSDPGLRELGLRLAEPQEFEERLSVLRINSFGGLELFIGEERLDERELKTQKVRFLLARLIGEHPKPVSIDRLLDEFWPAASDKAKNNLNTAVSLIRTFLREAYPNLDPVVRTVETLGLNPALPLWHDVDEMEKAYAKGRQAAEIGKLDTALNCFRRAALLYRAPYLESCYMDWALERRARLEILASEALRRLMNQFTAQHQHSQAAEYAIRLLGQQPDSTEAHEILMHSYIGLGKANKAAEHFETYQRQRTLEGERDELPMELLRLYHMARYGIGHEPALELG